MVHPTNREVIDRYIANARKLKIERQDFAWSEQEELDIVTQRLILRYAMAKCPDGKVTNVGWGFRIEFKHISEPSKPTSSYNCNGPHDEYDMMNSH